MSKSVAEDVKRMEHALEILRQQVSSLESQIAKLNGTRAEVYHLHRHMSAIQRVKAAMDLGILLEEDLNLRPEFGRMLFARAKTQGCYDELAAIIEKHARIG